MLPPAKYLYVVNVDGFAEVRGSADVFQDKQTECVAPLLEGRSPRFESGALITVRDRATGQPIEGAIVRIGSVSQWSDRQGLADLVAQTGKYRYHVRAKRYHGEKGLIDVPNTGQRELEVKLQHDPLSVDNIVSISVTDRKSGLPIEGAEVQVANHSQLTDSGGKAVCFLSAGDYSYLVKASEYQDSRGEVEVTESEDLHLQVALDGEGEAATTFDDDDIDNNSDIDERFGGETMFRAASPLRTRMTGLTTTQLRPLSRPRWAMSLWRSLTKPLATR